MKLTLVFGKKFASDYSLWETQISMRVQVLLLVLTNMKLYGMVYGFPFNDGCIEKQKIFNLTQSPHSQKKERTVPPPPDSILSLSDDNIGR